MRHDDHAPDAYGEYVARRRRDEQSTEAPPPTVSGGDDREVEYFALALVLSAVEFVGIGVAAALYAGATEGWAWAPLAFVGFPVYLAFVTVGTVFVPAFLVSWPLVHLLRRRR